MIIFDFISQEEIDDLPSDDSELAFTTFVRIAQGRLRDRTNELSGGQEGDWHQIEEARYGFMNVVVAAAKKFEIEPFVTLEVPRLENFNQEIHRQFKHDLDHYLTQLLLNNSGGGKKGSVFVSIETKESIRTYIHHLKATIDKSDIDESKKERLMRKLSEFEAELEKKRLSLVAVAMFSITFLSAPGGISATYEQIVPIATRVLRAVEEAKVADEENSRLPVQEVPKAITGPRAIVGKRNIRAKSGQRETFSQDLDDEIPF
jgi:hypothetical protein